jgi:DNA polymerase-4
LIAKNLVELTQDVISSMKEEGYRGRTVTVKVRFNDFKTYTRAKSLDKFTDSEPEIRRAAFDCLGRFELKKKVRLIGVRISNFEKVENEDRT